MNTLLNALRTELSARANPVWKAGAGRYAIEKMPNKIKAQAMAVKSRDVNEMLTINTSIP